MKRCLRVDGDIFENTPRVDADISIWMKKDAFSKVSGYVWRGLNPISHGGGGVFRPPNQTFLHCTETAQDMMTKLCDFYSNLIGNQNLNVSLF